MFEEMLISDVDLTNTGELYIIIRNKNDAVFNIILQIELKVGTMIYIYV